MAAGEKRFCRRQSMPVEVFNRRGAYFPLLFAGFAVTFLRNEQGRARPLQNALHCPIPAQGESSPPAPPATGPAPLMRWRF